MQMNNDKVRSPDNELPLVIFHWSLVIFFLCALSGREKKCIAGFQPAKVVLTQKELSRLRCRRDAGATIFSHDLRLCGEILFGCGSAALRSSVVSFCAVYADVQGAIPSSIQRLKSARRSAGHLSSQGMFPDSSCA